MSEVVKAPEVTAEYWIDENGNATEEGYSVQKNLGTFQVLFFYQHACPGCHLTGFPSMQLLTKELEGKAKFCVIQTAFEDFSNNSKDKLIVDQQKYNLKVPFGFDTGASSPDNYPRTMTSFRTGGTPWFVIINPEGEIVFADFRVNDEGLIQFIKENS